MTIKGKNIKSHETIDYIDVDMPEDPDGLSEDDVVKADTAMECAMAQRTATRIQGITRLADQFSTAFMPNYIEKHMESLLYLGHKLSRKTAEEGIALIRLIANTSIQMGDMIDMIDQMKEMRQVMMHSTNCQFQEYCAIASAVITRMSCAASEVAAENLGACAKVINDTVATSENGAFIAAAITSWCMLLEDCDPKTVTNAFELQPVLYELLRSSVLEVRLSAGEALAFLHEYRSGVEFENHDDVMDTLSDMRGLLGKQISKKSRRLQRSSIKQVYEFINGDSGPEYTIGANMVTLKSFAMKMFYDCCCDVMNGGIDIHLMRNDKLRMVFGLESAPIELEPVSTEEKRSEKTSYRKNQKARSKLRKLERSDCIDY